MHSETIARTLANSADGSAPAEDAATASSSLSGNADRPFPMYVTMA